jgi:thiol:disulfide interchange protein DsbD
MERYTFTDGDVLRELGGFVLLKVDVTDQDPHHVDLQRRFGIVGPPATLFFGCSGQEKRPLRLVGFEDAPAFVQRLQQARSC